jgi:lipoate-protein ligase A
MHGEYKLPGGKLVIADLEVQAGQLRNVKLSGDFFLEPDTALAQMDAALEGLAADTAEAELAARVGEAVGGAELIGITPTGVAIAVRRAVAGAAQ